MIYKRAFYNEAGLNIATVLMALGGLFGMVLMARLLAETLSVSATSVLVLLGLELLKITPQLCTVALFAGLVMTFSRMSQSREMAAWQISGLRDIHWNILVVFMAVPMAMAIWVLALHAAPWSIRQSSSYQTVLADKAKLEDTAPGIFGEIEDQNLVYHLGALSPDRRQALGIFIVRRQGPMNLQIVLTDKAETVIDDVGLRNLRMEKGELHNLSFSTKAATKIDFAKAEFQFGKEERIDTLRLRGRTLASLGGQPAARTEYFWRHSFAAAALLFGFMAFPIGRLSPGSGRSYQVLLAVLSYWLYYAISGYAKDLGNNGDIAPAAAAFSPLVLVTLALFALLALDKKRP